MQEQCNSTTWNIQHVKGHQKEKDLTREATLNNIADTLTTEAQQALPWNRQYQTVPLYPENKINVTIKNKTITRVFNREIQQALTAIDIRAYMEDRNGWNKTITNKTDWEIHGSNLLKLTYYQHKFVVKLIHERLPCLGEKFTISTVQLCPVCKQHTKTSEHFQLQYA
eukprot:4419520-Ditylum_brightwellii.AAC.1